MEPKNGSKKRTAKRNSIWDDMESEEGEESEGTKQLILVAEQQSWREPLDIIATKGYIRGIKI